VTRARQLADAVIAALVAPRCAACGRLIELPLDGAVCARCWASIVRAPAPFALSHIRIAQALGPYDGTLRDILHAFKYDGRRSCAPRLSTLLADAGRHLLTNADAVVPVPLHRRRQRQRGFNQAADLSAGLGKPVWDAIRRIRFTTSQVELPADRRRQNVSGAFAVVVARRGMRALFRPERYPLRGATVVLVDDVTTTGATLEACATVLRRAGVREVRALTAARVVR
jgi:ComF family protein